MRLALWMSIVLLATCTITFQSSPKKHQLRGSKHTAVRGTLNETKPRPVYSATPHVQHPERTMSGPVGIHGKKHVVDEQWMAKYRELEEKWKYKIPEDAHIEFKDGKYHVPTVVFKHYDDLLATPSPE